MTINEIVNCFNLMSQTTIVTTTTTASSGSSTKRRAESNEHDNVHAVTSTAAISSQSLPSIVISSSASPFGHNVTVTNEIADAHTADGLCKLVLCATTLDTADTFAVEHLKQIDESTMQPLDKSQTDKKQNGNNHRRRSKESVIFSEHSLHNLISLDQVPNNGATEEQNHNSAISRPTSLSANCASLTIREPPEFSISPADPISKASSNEQISSNLFNCKSPHSPPLSLNVNFGCHNNSNLIPSHSFTSLHSSCASSMNDLTMEGEQFERAIRRNDVKFVSRVLERYLGKQKNLEKSSLSSSRRSSTKDDKAEYNRPVLKSQTAFDEHHYIYGGALNDAQSPTRRRESDITEDHECSLFVNSLHIAIENNSYEVTILLLKSGIDANRPGVAPYSVSDSYWRRSSHTSEDSCANVRQHDRLSENNLGILPPKLTASREPLIAKTPSIRAINSPMLLSPQAVGSSFFGPNAQQGLNQLLFSANSSFSSINSDLFNMGMKRSSIGTKLLCVRPSIVEPECIVYTRPDGTHVRYEDEYNRERLFTLPPIFLAVALSNSAILRQLIAFGANVNAVDAHGVTPLHICLCQEHISRACLQLLVQSGAKMCAHNLQSIAPFQLVHQEQLDEILYLQKFIIDDLLCSLLPERTMIARQKSSQLTRKDALMYANYKSVDTSSGHNSSANLAAHQTNNNIHVTKMRQQSICKEESVDSCSSSGPTLSKFFDFSKAIVGTPSAETPVHRRKVQIDAQMTKHKTANADDSFSTQVPAEIALTQITSGGVNEESGSLFLPSAISNLMAHKRSFAFESSTASGGNKATATSSNNNDATRTNMNNSTLETFSSTVGSRLFGRRRSGDEIIKNQIKQAAKREAFSRANTQEESLRVEEAFARTVESNLDVLCQMSRNIECIPLIIASLRKHLPEIIALSDSQKTLTRLQCGLSRLFDRSLQTIVDNFIQSREEISAATVATEIALEGDSDDGELNTTKCFKPRRKTGTITPNHEKRKTKTGNTQEQHQHQRHHHCHHHHHWQQKCGGGSSIQSLFALQQNMTGQLCGLLVCALQCLKGGQTFQYSSLLIVNLIIDSLIRFEISTVPFNWNMVLGDGDDLSQPHRYCCDRLADQSDNVGDKMAASNEKYTSSAASTAAANLSRHFRSLRINDSFHFKQNFVSRDEKTITSTVPIAASSGVTASTEASATFATEVPTSSGEFTKNRRSSEPKIESKKISDHNRFISWIKQVHLSPKLTQRRQLNDSRTIGGGVGCDSAIRKVSLDDINKSSTNTAGATSKSPVVDHHYKDGSSNTASHTNDFCQSCCPFGKMTTTILILVQEGLDLILNVLNNAITLHKRVAGSKHSCTPSKRSRQCIYHCLQILSARAILYGSQCEEAQRRLMKEGPLKVLIASIDSTHDPQLICLTLQVIANLSINPHNHAKLIEFDLADCLMQLILPSDEWFYTNHSTKYAKFVKHQAARIMVYLGLEKRLRNKVYLFDLMEELGEHSPQSESPEDCYITQTSVAPNAVYSRACPTLLIGSSVEAIILDLIKQVEDKIVNGEESLCIDPLNDESYFMVESGPDAERMVKEPPAIQVDMPSGIIGDRRITNQHPNCFFYLSTLPMALQPIIILRVLQHRMFGCYAYWAWNSNAVSRASVVSVGGSSIEYNRSRASSHDSNTNFEIANAFNLNKNRNINLHCSNTSLSPARIEVERRPSFKGLIDNRLTLQNSLPLGGGSSMPKAVHLSNSLSTIGQNVAGNVTSYCGNKLPVQIPLQRRSLIEQQLHHHIASTVNTTGGGNVDSPTDSPSAYKRFRFSSLRRNRHSLSTENNTLPSVVGVTSCSPASSNVAGATAAAARNNSLDASERNEAYIIAFQRELQNLPKSESPSPIFGVTGQHQQQQTALTNSLVSIIREAFERTGTPLKRPRSCSVPRITLENFSSTLLQLPASIIDKNQSQVAACAVNPLIRSATSDGSCSNVGAHATLNSGQSPSLSPIKVTARALNESPISFSSTLRSNSRSGSRSGSAGQVATESIIPNVHKAILRLLLDWVSSCPNDFQQNPPRRELVDFLNRVSLLGENYRWFVEEIRFQVDIDEKENLIEQPSNESLLNKEYKAMQNLILGGELPCSKDEAAKLAVFQQRIEEISPQSKENENRHMLPSSSLRQNSIIEEKLRPISEDLKESSAIKSETCLRQFSSVNMSSSFDELEEDEDQNEFEVKDVKVSGHASSRILTEGHFGDARFENSVNNNGNGTCGLPSFAKKKTSRFCHWVSSNWANKEATSISSIDVRQCLPPMYHNAKSIVKAIKEQKRKLFHTPAYDSEVQLKKLYIHTCKRLPAFGCRIFQVKELLHSKTNRRATRLLGICLERIVLLDSKTLQQQKAQPTSNLQQWRTGGGRSHDRLVLEFRGSKWSFVTPSHGSLRAIGTVLWEIMQDLDACFLDTLIAGERICNATNRDSGSRDKTNSKTAGLTSEYHHNHGLASKTMRFRDELQRLEALLHFPEEVALRLTEVEHKLFYSIEPVHYIRQVTIQLNSLNDLSTCESEANKSEKTLTVKQLIERFTEVSTWITHLIISQPTHEMRKAILSCIMRVVQTCWNLGNFNSAVEILAGLKSEKLKPFWLSIEQKDEPFLRKKLTDILLTLEEPSPEYQSAVIRALDIPHSKTIPFFGAFLRDLKTILQRMPSLIVLSSEPNKPPSLQSDRRKEATTKIDSISEFNGEDNYMSRIGVGGIINLGKMYKTHQVLDNIRTFHIHAIRRNQLIASLKCVPNNIWLVAPDDGSGRNRYYQLYCDQFVQNELSGRFEPKRSMSEESRGPQQQNKQQTSFPSINSIGSQSNKYEKEQLYQMEINCYKPIQLLPKSHGISVIPLDVHLIDYHNLQAMHHGMSAIHYEEDTGRSAVVFLQLEESNSTLMWCKPFWSTMLRSSGNAPQDYQLSLNIEDTILAGVMMKYETREAAMIALDEGFIDLMYLKDIVVGQTNVDLNVIARRHSLPEYILMESGNCSIKLQFGMNLSDNRTTEFIAPKNIATLWVDGLRSVLQLIQEQKKLCDQRMLWLKEKYLQLYYEDSGCAGPTPAEAIRTFGGRKWTIESMSSSHQSLHAADPIFSKCANVTGGNAAGAVGGSGGSNSGGGGNFSKNRKKKSTVSLSVIRDHSTRSQLSITSEPESRQNSPRSSRSQHQSPQSSYRLHSPSKSADAAASIAVGTIIESENVYDSQSSLSVQSTSSCELTKNANVFDCSPIHTSLLTFNYREKFCKRNQLSLLDSFGSSGSNKMQQQQQRQHQQQSSTVPGRKAATSADTSAAAPSRNSKHKTHATAITHSTNMDFIEFSNLFRSFLVCIRRDIKDIFEQIASKSDIHTFLEAESNYFEEKYAKQEKTTLSNTKSKKESTKNRSKFLGLLTRNSDSELNDDDYHKCRIFDAIARASIVTNSAGINTLKTSLLLDTDFYVFITTYQCETITLEEVRRLIAQHEPNPILCQRGCLSFEGFARYLMDKNNFAYTPELSEICTEDMDHPLSHYYMASSHNTYLTGHQLKGESSVELYSQVLLTGCRCVELDCWDGEDGMPLIYHGHTFTSKIPFKKVVETINEKAFVASPYPVILSVENHCSLQQQAKMAQIFLQVFGDKLVTKFLFDSDYCDEPQLPSPNQLKYRILIKNKKLRAPLHPSVHLRSRSAIPSVSKIANGRTNSLVSNVSIGSLNDDDDDEYDDEDDEDDVDDSALQSANMLDSIDSTKKTEDGGGSGEMATVTKKSFNSSSKSGKSSLHPSEQSHHSLETDNHQISGSPYVQNSKIVRKSSSQIAPELSDLVIYSQAIKFRGLLSSAYNLSPTGSAMGTPISKKLASRKALSSATFNSTIQASASLLPVIESNKIRDELRELNTASPTLLVTTTATLTTTATAPASTTIVTTFSSTSASASASTTAANTNINKRPNSSAPCYQISSINENTAKKLCRKSPLTVIAHTENQIMRTYPARMRIDSSNFNPVIFWAFGIQSVALNYQTVDSALHINSAMFEQNGGCGYVLKTSAMRDKSHLMFGRFNPYEKEFDGLHTITLTFTVISGQYVCPNTNTGSPLVEMEIIGIPVDTCRQRTKIVQRNSLNPIWNDTFFFRIKFVDLAFLRITVMDMGANHLAAQRIVPLKCLKQGYRHLRLHSPQNQNLPLSTLFIYSCFEEEGLDIEHESDKMKLKNKMISKIDLNRFEGNKSEGSAGTAPVKRRMFFLMVHGVMPEEPSTILKITQESTAADVISQALTKANKANENVNDYVLLEEVSRGWEKKRMSERNTITQRLLDPSERPLEAQSNWKGEGRFVLKKMADDPSTRAWMTSIRSSSSNKDRLKREDATYTSAEEAIADWEAEPENETFLVCIYNVSQDQPYTILKSSVTSSSQDIITQALLKAHRDEDPKSFVIIEEAENFGDANTTELSSSFSFKSKTGTGYRRVLDDNENIYVAQTQWKNKGKFELKYRKEVTANDNTYIKTSTSSASAKLLRGRGSFKKLSQLHRSYSKRLQQRKDCSESPPASNRKSYNNCATTCDVGSSGSPSIKSNESPQPIRERKNENDLELKKQKEQKNAENDETRQAHSEGEMPSDSEEKSKDSSVGSLTRLKKLSLKRLKVWKS